MNLESLEAEIGNKHLLLEEKVSWKWNKGELSVCMIYV